MIISKKRNLTRKLKYACFDVICGQELELITFKYIQKKHLQLSLIEKSEIKLKKVSLYKKKLHTLADIKPTNLT